jgi:hypothetical protein
LEEIFEEEKNCEIVAKQDEAKEAAETQHEDDEIMVKIDNAFTSPI